MKRFAIFANSYQGQLKRGLENTHKYINSDSYGIQQRKDSTTETQDFYSDSGLLKLYEKVSEYQVNKELPTIFGGDHHIARGTVASSLKNYGDNFKLLWIDAHTDINTEKSESRKQTWYACSFFNGSDGTLDIRCSFIKTKQIIYFGIRSVDDFEMEMLKHYKIETYFADDIIKSKNSNLH